MHAEQSNPNKYIVEQNVQVWRPMGSSTTNNAKHEMRIHINTSSLIYYTRAK